jgi:hypothetical protein
VRDTIVQAPHDGRVTGLNVETGEYVALRESLTFGDFSVHSSDRMDNLLKAHS